MASAAAAQPDLPVDLLEEIFLRLDDTADLVRASAACASFRRLVFDSRFLRRFRSLHRPPVLGFLIDCYRSDRGFSFYPVEPPHRSAPAARALARAGDFSVSCLPGPTHYWRVRDVRDGRVLLSRRSANATSWYVFEYLVVYDPLHGRQVQIPPIPDDLLASTGHDGGWRWLEFNPFLVPAAADEEEKDEDDLSFRVMCNVLFEHKLETFVYSSVNGEWHGVASLSIASYEPMKFPCFLDRHYAHSCFYWVDCLERVMLVLDMREMKFSVVDLPPRSEYPEEAIVVEAAEDRVGLLIIGENTLDLYSKTWRDIGVGGKDWRHDHRIPLLDDYLWSFASGVAEGYALLRGVPRDEYQVWQSCPAKEPPNAHCFIVELETLLVEELCVLKFYVHPDFLYASFPPPFALPSI